MAEQQPLPAWLQRISTATVDTWRSLFRLEPSDRRLNTHTSPPHMAQPPPQHHQQHQHKVNAQRSHTTRHRANQPHLQLPRPVQRFSPDSSEAFPNSAFFSNDFMLGAGMVVIQPSTGKVVVVWDSQHHYYFLPKGRKDVGESIEQAALRECYEESGYRVDFLPLLSPTNAPFPPGSRPRLGDPPPPNTEPIYITTQSWAARQRFIDQPPRAGQYGGEYLTFWYVGQIPEDAVREEDTGMANEKHFVSTLMEIGEALHSLATTGAGFEAVVMQKAYDLWVMTKEAESQAVVEEDATDGDPSLQPVAGPSAEGEGAELGFFEE